MNGRSLSVDMDTPCKALVSFYTDTEMFAFKEGYRFNISTRKNLAIYSMSVDKPSTSFVSTGCTKLSTSLKQLLTSLTGISDLLQGCANNSDTVPLSVTRLSQS